MHKKSEPKNKYGNFNAKLLILEMHLNNYYVLSSIDFSHKSPKMAQIHVNKYEISVEDWIICFSTIQHDLFAIYVQSLENVFLFKNSKFWV